VLVSLTAPARVWVVGIGYRDWSELLWQVSLELQAVKRARP
jgi:hypothetical protein